MELVIRCSDSITVVEFICMVKVMHVLMCFMNGSINQMHEIAQAIKVRTIIFQIQNKNRIK